MKNNILARLVHVLGQFVSMEEHELLSVALWVLHTHVFQRYMHTPRLVLTSPVRGCGKTTVLDCLSILACRAHKADGVSAAVFFHRVQNDSPTMLLDESDNLPLVSDPIMRAAFNAGHRQGGSIERLYHGTPRAYHVFAPLCLAGIVGRLPLPLAARSIIISMKRHDGVLPLRRFDSSDIADLRNLHREIVRWAKQVTLNTNLTLPAGLKNRPGDNWRPLISIADSFGWGEAARQAALAFNNGHHDEDAGIRLLSDIRDIFNARDVDRIKSAVLVSALVALDDAPWSEWRGVHDDQTPRPLSQNDLARLLFPFNIKTQTVWPLHRHALGESSGRGYFRSQFEAAWISYCGVWADTVTQPPAKEKRTSEWVSPLA